MSVPEIPSMHVPSFLHEYNYGLEKILNNIKIINEFIIEVPGCTNCWIRFLNKKSINIMKMSESKLHYFKNVKLICSMPIFLKNFRDLFHKYVCFYMKINELFCWKTRIAENAACKKISIFLTRSSKIFFKKPPY